MIRHSLTLLREAMEARRVAMEDMAVVAMEDTVEERREATAEERREVMADMAVEDTDTSMPQWTMLPWRPRLPRPLHRSLTCLLNIMLSFQTILRFCLIP